MQTRKTFSVAWKLLHKSNLRLSKKKKEDEKMFLDLSFLQLATSCSLILINDLLPPRMTTNIKARSPEMWPLLFHSHSFMQTYINKSEVEDSF